MTISCGFLAAQPRENGTTTRAQQTYDVRELPRPLTSDPNFLLQRNVRYL